MRMGMISDIHGNLAALHCVWDALCAQGLCGSSSLVLNAGDTVGYGDDPQGCLDFLRGHANIVTVQGNYDRSVARYPERKDAYKQKWGRLRPEKLEAIARDSARITGDARAFLLSLPREREIDWHGMQILLTHYAPGVKEGLGPWTGSSRLANLAARTDCPIVVCGHTHAPFARTAGGTLFINPGTVGRAFDSRPAYAVLSWESPSAPTVQLAQVKV